MRVEKENEKSEQQFRKKKKVVSIAGERTTQEKGRVLKDVNAQQKSKEKLNEQPPNRTTQLDAKVQQKGSSTQLKKQQSEMSCQGTQVKETKSGSVKSATTTTGLSHATAGGTSRTSRAPRRTSNAMWIRPRSKTPHCSNGRRCKMDPVQLYQYYRNEWDKFSNHLPGQNPRTELRWQIRHKLSANNE